MFFSTTDTTTESSQDVYYTIGVMSGDKTEILNQAVKAEQIQLVIEIKFPPRL